jgi:hypothetical protein
MANKFKVEVNAKANMKAIIHVETEMGLGKAKILAMDKVLDGDVEWIYDSIIDKTTEIGTITYEG